MSLKCLIIRSFSYKLSSSLMKVRSNGNIFNIFCRTLFTPESLKITSFEENMINISQTISDPDKFKKLMRDKCEKNINFLVFQDDIKKIMSLTHTDEDVKLLLDMIKKFCCQSNVVRFGMYSIGPEIMRLLYVLNRPLEALELLKNPELCTLFFQTSSILILVNFLFEKQMYEEVIQCFHFVAEKQLQGRKYLPSLVTLYYASCYMLNNPEVFKDALNTWNDFEKREFFCPLRPLWFFLALSLKQNHADLVLEVLSQRKPNSINENFKVLALCQKKEWKTMFDILDKVVHSDVPTEKSEKMFFCIDTITQLEIAISHSDEKTKNIFNKLKMELIAHNFVAKNALEAYLLEKINYSNTTLKQKRSLQSFN